MSLEAFYFISQIVATFLLFVSLIFVGIQIKHNTSAVRAASAFDINRMWGEYNLNASFRTEEALFRMKLLDPSKQVEDFSEVEIAKARMISLGFSQLWLSQFRLYQEGSLLREDWERHGKWAAHFGRLPIIQMFNDEAIASGHIVPEFSAELERLDALIETDVGIYQGAKPASPSATASSANVEET